MIPILWRAMAGGQGVLLATLGAVAFAIGSMSTIAVFAMRRRLTQRFGEHAARLSWAAGNPTASAAYDERRRIARDVQDIVGHPLAVITRLTDGAAVTVRKDPDVAAEAMNQAAATSRQTLKDLRRFLKNLRDEPERHPTRS